MPSNRTLASDQIGEAPGCSNSPQHEPATQNEFVRAIRSFARGAGRRMGVRVPSDAVGGLEPAGLRTAGGERGGCRPVQRRPRDRRCRRRRRREAGHLRVLHGFGEGASRDDRRGSAVPAVDRSEVEPRDGASGARGAIPANRRLGCVPPPGDGSGHRCVVAQARGRPPIGAHGREPPGGAARAGGPVRPRSSRGRWARRRFLA